MGARALLDALFIFAIIGCIAMFLLLMAGIVYSREIGRVGRIIFFIWALSMQSAAVLLASHFDGTF